jgi:hypothetical protein
VNGTIIQTDISKSAALFEIVQEQLSTDSCARTFHFNDLSVLDSLLSLSSNPRDRIPFEMESLELCEFSFEKLNDLLSNELISIESEDSLLKLLLNLGSEYRELLGHIEIRFLSPEGLSILIDESDPPESLWQSVVKRFDLI